MRPGKGEKGMGSYIPTTEEQRQRMLETVGLTSTEELFAALPEEVKLKGELPKGLSELGAARKMEDYAEENRIFRHIFRGAGAYDHYIPSIVKEVVSKEEFVTAYTPYQAEISQGLLQSIFEYQTMLPMLPFMTARPLRQRVFLCAGKENAPACWFPKPPILR